MNTRCGATILLLCGTAACESAVPDGTADARADAPADAYVVEFPGTPEKGPAIGSNTNIAITIDRDQPVRRYDTRVTGNQSQPGMRITYDFRSDCQDTPLLSAPVRDLEAGDFAFVEYVDVEMSFIDVHQDRYDVCAGYRTADGTWRFIPTSVPFTRDGDVWTARIPIHAGPTDALKIVVGMGQQPLSKITIVTGEPGGPR